MHREVAERKAHRPPERPGLAVGVHKVLHPGLGVKRLGQWVEVTGTVKADADGSLRVLPTSVVTIDEPEDPYEY